MYRLFPAAPLTSSIVLTPPAAQAQSPGEPQRRPSVSPDATIATSTGYTAGEYVENNQGSAADVLLAVGFGRAVGGRMVVGLNGSAHGTGTSDLLCKLDPAGDCVPRFPSFTLLGAVVGWESGRSMLRTTVGAAPARAYGDWHEWHLAWQGRLDGALPIIPHVAAVASLRGTLVPDYRGDSLRLLALGVGLRLH